MATLRGHTWLLLLGLLACTDDLNPCPKGSILDRVERRCVRIVDIDVDEIDGGNSPPGSEPGDGGADANGMDAGTHDTGTPPDGRGPEPVDAGPCSQHDVDAWRAFHRADGAVTTLTTCIAEHCDAGTCYPEPCIRDAIGLDACDECVDRESACVLEFCNSACGLPGNDGECRACTCESGCVAQFDQCAQVSLDVCENVHGRDAVDAELTLQGTWLLRMKGPTGFLQVGPLSPTPPRYSYLYTTAHLSEGFTHATPFRAHGRQYLLQHKSECGNAPCIARISTVLSDGSLGRPLYMDTWTAGWDEIEAFAVSGVSYLLRYKTGDASTSEEPKGELRIERLVFNGDLTSITLQPVLSVPNTPINSPPWSEIESFEFSGHTYLLRYGTERTGELQFLRVEPSEDSLVLTPVFGPSSWSRGWDIVETFEHEGLPYVALYKSGRLPMDGESAASAKVQRIRPGANLMGFDLSPIFEGTWPSWLTHVLPFRHAGATHLLSYSGVSGKLYLYSLDDNPSLWATELAASTWDDQGQGTSPWDIMEILQGSEPTSP